MSRANWVRPSDPLNVWRTIDVEGKTNNNTTSSFKLSIQEIPLDRYEEALDHMCDYLLVDEVKCVSLRVKDNPNAVNDFRSVWSYCLEQGISIGAFKLNSNGELGELIGMNVLMVLNGTTKKGMEDIILNFKSTETKKIFTVLNDVSGKVDICKIYGVDRYLTAMGLSVKPTYRGCKLSVHLLEARKDIGRKYGILVTSTTFAAPSSQIQAQRAGFETMLTVRYSDIFDENGQPAFPNIAAEAMKIMVKQL